VRNSAVVMAGMTTSADTKSACRDDPKVWLLLDDRPGHRTQVIGLASSLGWPYETRQLAFNRLNKVPNPILGAGLTSLDRSASDSLDPPYPDLVIAMGRRCIPIARWIRRASGDRTRLVQLGRKGVTSPGDFGLLVSCAHFNFPHTLGA
jgi:mitochondrial fission protein ELM1